MPVATVTAVRGRHDTIVLAVANQSGAVFATRGRGTDWGLWQTVSEGSATPGATVSAVSGDDGLVSLFLADAGGGVFTARGIDQSWSTWTSVSEGSSVPGGTVTAVPDGDQIALFLSDPGGGVYTARGGRTSWSPWSSVSGGASVPGGVISVLQVDSADHGRFAVLLVDAAGGVDLATRAGSGVVALGHGGRRRSTPGARIGAASWFDPSLFSTRHLLAIADPHGGVYVKDLPL